MVLLLVRIFSREQAEVIHAGGADFVNGLHDVAIFRARVGAHENGFVEAIGDEVLDLGGDFVEPTPGAAQETFCRRG